MQLSAILSHSLIDLELLPVTREGAIAALADRMQALGILSDPEAYLAAVLARESETPTNVGLGVAIPHAKSRAVRRAAVAFGRSPDGITWDRETVHMVFLLAVPESGAAQDHLEILATLAQLLLDEQFRRALLMATTAGEVYDTVVQSLKG